MRYGLGELPSGQRSTLRERVSERMVRLELTTGELAKKAGVSTNTLKNLGDQGTIDRTLHKLAAPLGFSYEQLARWRAEDAAQQHGVAADQFPATVYRAAVKMMELDEGEQQRVLAMIIAYADKRPVTN